MAYMGFSKLKAKLASSGAKNPEGAAASIMRKKYPKKEIIKHQQSGTSMKTVKHKKIYG